MLKDIIFFDKQVAIKLSNAALAQSKTMDSPLVIEIQVYFSCLLGKRLAFYSEKIMKGAWCLDKLEFEEVIKKSEHLTGNVYISFNTVMTKSCPVSDYIGPPPVTDFEIKNQAPYVPSWLNIGFNNDQWSGQFGWDASESGLSNTKQIRGRAQQVE